MFSKDLELSIASLFDKAHEANIQYITVEHLLLMILSDFEVKEFFKSQDIQIESLKQSLNDHLKNMLLQRLINKNQSSQHLDFKEFYKERYFIFNHLEKVW